MLNGVMPILGEVSVVSTSDFQSVLDTIQAQLSVSTIVGVLAIGAGIAVGFTFMWWGVRKLIKVIMSGVKKGKISI